MDYSDIHDFLQASSDLIEMPEVKTPKYNATRIGDWEVIDRTVDRPMRGYFNGMSLVSKTPVLVRHNETGAPTVWMSLTPMELESHAPHIEKATGTVVVGGLGLGMYVYNILQKPEVTKVVVVEKEAAIADMFTKIMVDDGWRALADEKLHIIIDDIIEPSKDETQELCVNADYLYVDIWATMCDEAALPDMIKIVEWVDPTECGWWCMEMDYISIFHRHLEVSCLAIDHSALEDAETYFDEQYHLPVQMSTIEGYPRMLQAFTIQMLHSL